MTLEQNPESTAAPRPPLGPPEGRIGAVQAIFWNERELRAGWRLLVYLLLFFLIAWAENLVATVLHLPQINRTSLAATSMLVQEAIGMIAALAAAAIMGMLEARPFGDYGLPRAAAFGAPFRQGVAWGIAMITGTILLIRAFGGFSFGSLALRGPALWGYAALWGMVFLCVGFFEEFLFRGYAQFTLATGIGFWPAAMVLSAAFGALHLANRGEDKIGALSVFVIGMFFCLTLRRTGNLWFAVGLHAAFDWGESYLFSVPDSGLVSPGHLLNSSFHGPAWLTGGTVGPEGSVMAFVVIGIAAAIFARAYPALAAHATVVGGDSTAIEAPGTPESKKLND
jgi:membrane protease YdiL (CAAX protease family)